MNTATPSPGRRRRHLVAATTACLVVLAGCGDAGDTPAETAGTTLPTVDPGHEGATTSTSVPTADPFDRETARRELAAARRRWAAAAPNAYTLRFEPNCFCDLSEVTVRVLGDHVVDRRTDRIDAPQEEAPWGSVDDWFGEIEQAIETAYSVRATYGDDGAPTSVWIDVEDRIADEEYGMTLVSIEPIESAGSTLFTEPYACGYGFWAASPGQRASLQLGFDHSGDAPIAGVYDVAELPWSQMQLGAELMANWCNDVFEEDGPHIEETWELVAGTIEITEITETEATAEATGLVARSPSGEEIQLGDTTLWNRMWGFFAG